MSSVTEQASASTRTTGALIRPLGSFLHMVEPRDHALLGRWVARIRLLGLFGLRLAGFAARFLLALCHHLFLGCDERRCPSWPTLGAIAPAVASFRQRRSSAHPVPQKLGAEQDHQRIDDDGKTRRVPPP